MALPRVSQPTFTLTIPSTGKEVRYRPFTVREEKILLIAQASGERKDYINAFKQLITNCIVDPIDVDVLASFDVEYIFICLRAKSVSNKVELKFKDELDQEVTATVNLDEVKVHKTTVSSKIILSEEQELGVKLKFPTFAEIEKLTRRDDGDVSLTDGLDLLIDLIDLIWEGESVYAASEHTRDELREFVNDFTADNVSSIETFLDDLPFVYLDMNYVDSTGAEKSRRITGIESFFG